MLKAEWFNLHEEDRFASYYSIVEKWWQDWNWVPPSPASLSSNGIMISDKNGKNICAGWVYSSDSSMCFMGFLISDKKVSGKIKKEALKFLIKSLEVLAKTLGFKIIYFPVTVNSLSDLVNNELGFNKAQQAYESYKLI